MAEESEVGLLEKAGYSYDYQENCGGCEIERRKDTQPGPPWKLLSAVWVIVLVNALPISSLFPFLYFMIRDFHIAKQEEDIGYYGGLVGSAFMLGRALTSIAWGIIADKYGRKPVIILGTVAVVIFNTLFGFSVNISMAIINRFLLGALNGLFGPIRAYISEICRDEHQSIGMTVMTTAWGIGLVIGPALGGLLAQPAEKYPHLISKESLLGRFPYSLPCLCTSFFAVIIAVASFWLPESLHVHKLPSSPEHGMEDPTSTSDDATGNYGGNVEERPTNSKKSLYKNWALMSSIIVFCVFSLHDMAYTEIFSLWAVSPRKVGGLGYTTEDTGLFLALTGLGMLVFQLFFYPYLDRTLGPVVGARICGILSIPLLQSYPFIALLSGLSLTLLLNFASIIKNILSTSIVISTFILQNRAVAQEQRGAANGISLTTMSICKTIGPAFGGSLLSWAEKRKTAAFLPGTHMIFFLLNVVELLGVLMTFKPFLVES